MLRVGVADQLESIGELEQLDCLTRSVPNIAAPAQGGSPDALSSTPPSASGAACGEQPKRAESEPSIPHLVDSEQSEAPPPSL
ncbi:hypothetical protein LSTR_LSTR015366 [Laodelphax striatellus]|uniref:Uncharacterized protein n=1 Tax=Laodelphax striatellus TaxID=195883 RepID=A0A482WIR2_LAOST|nr:hypothetical protein LSTR_LSTR015366 [Laodelphax striatellus]